MGGNMKASMRRYKHSDDSKMRDGEGAMQVPLGESTCFLSLTRAATRSPTCPNQTIWMIASCRHLLAIPPLRKGGVGGGCVRGDGHSPWAVLVGQALSWAWEAGHA